jgi:hypothetical protein
MPLKGRAQSAGFVGDSTPIVFSLPFEATHWVQQLVGNGSPGMNRDQIGGNQAIQRQGEGAGGETCCADSRCSTERQIRTNEK